MFDSAELQLQKKCSKYGVRHYVNPDENESERSERHQELGNECTAESRRRDAVHKRNVRKIESVETKEKEAQRKKGAYNKSDETRQREARRKRDDRLHQSEQAKQHDAQRKRDAYNKSDETKQLEAKRKRDAYHESEETEKLQAAKKRSYRKNKKSKALINDTGPVDREEETTAGNESIDIPDISTSQLH